MNEAAFRPVSVVGGLLAGIAAAKVFELIWSRFDDEEAPDADQEDVPWGKLMLAMAIEGAIARMIRAATDRGTRIAFQRATGSWPGEED